MPEFGSSLATGRRPRLRAETVALGAVLATLAAAEAAEAAAADAPAAVDLVVDAISALRPSDGDALEGASDELSIRLVGRSGDHGWSARLPNGAPGAIWRLDPGALRGPADGALLWSGPVGADDDRATLLLALLDRDAGPRAPARAVLRDIFSACARAGRHAASRGTLAEDCAEAADLARALPSSPREELIGAVFLSLEARAGRLRARWVAADADGLAGPP